jgi:hypothetical protein
MGLLKWFRRDNGEDGRLRTWRRKWAAAAEACDGSRHPELARELESFGLPDDDVEIEREMLEALERVRTVAASVDASGLPSVETGHRVVGADVCHFISPVSMPDETAQPSGRLLLTNARAIFVGGANGAAAPWHAIGEVAHVERDLVLVRADRQKIYRFRCNTFGDALEATYLAKRLVASRRQSPAPSKEK